MNHEVDVPRCPKCKGQLKKYGQHRRRPTFSCESCGWTNDLRLDRASRIIRRMES